MSEQQNGAPAPATNSPEIPPSPNDAPPPGAAPGAKHQEPAPAAPAAEQPLMSTEQLNERLERERRSYLRKLGFESEADFRKAQEERERLAKEAEEAERAKMSEVERYRSDYAEEKARREALEEQMRATQFEAHVTKTCAQIGVTNVEYAMFEVMRATDSMKEGDDPLNVEEHLKQLAEQDAAKRASLGMAAPPPPVEQNPAPATTSPTPSNPEPAPPPPGEAPSNSDAFGMNDSTWLARKQALGLS